MDDTTRETPAQEGGQFAKRDAETQMVLGSFVTLIAIPVLIGSFWATTTRARVVNVVAGLVLLGIGVCIAALGWRRRRS